MESSLRATHEKPGFMQVQEMRGAVGRAVEEAAVQEGYDPQNLEVVVIGPHASGMALKTSAPGFGIVGFVQLLSGKNL